MKKTACGRSFFVRKKSWVVPGGGFSMGEKKPDREIRFF